jgi:hypothetical protein
MNVHSSIFSPLSVFLDLECDLNPGILCCQCKTGVGVGVGARFSGGAKTISGKLQLGGKED